MSSFAPTDRPARPEIPASAAGAAPTPLHAPIPVPWPPPLRPLDEAARAAPLELPAIPPWTAPAPRHEDPPPPDPALRSVSYRTAPVPDEEHAVALPAPLDEAPSPLRIAGPIVGASLVLLAALVAALSR